MINFTFLVTLAHLGEAVEEHDDVVNQSSDVAAISPVVVVVVIAVVALIGLLVWYVLRKK